MKFFRFVVAGYDTGSKAYYSYFTPSTYKYNSVFTSPAPYTMTALSSSEYPITTGTGPTFSSLASQTVTTPTVTNSAVTYEVISTTNNGIYENTSTESISFVYSTINTYTPSLTCSGSSATTLQYSLANYGLFTVPSWVVINSSTGILTITAPIVTSDTEYDFYVQTQASAYSFSSNKLIKLTIKAPAPSASAVAQALGKYIFSLIIITCAVVIVLSLMKLTTTLSFWAMVGQMQMLFLIFLTRSATSEDVREVVRRSDFTMNIFYYISLSKINFYDKIYSNIDFQLSTSSLADVGLKSDSSIYNIYPVYSVIILVILVHLCLHFLLPLILEIKNDGRWGSFGRALKWTFRKLDSIMKFGFYIRSCYLMCQFILICSIYEIFKASTNDSNHRGSYVFSLVMLLFYWAFTGLTILLALLMKENEKHKLYKFREFFWGIKDLKRFKSYMVVFPIRRAIYAFFLVGLSSISSQSAFAIITALQFFFVVYVVILRPFKELLVNVIEIMNEGVLLLLVFIINFFPSGSNWTSEESDLYVSIIVINISIIFLMIISKIMILPIFSPWSMGLYQVDQNKTLK